MVANPGFIPKFRNIVSNEAPITISGVAIGRNINILTSERPLNAYRPIANAIKVPSTVAIAVDNRPIFSEFPSALQTSGAPQGLRQLLKVKPRQTKLLLVELLNEKTKV